MTETQVRIRVTTSGQEKLERLAKSTGRVEDRVNKLNRGLPKAQNNIRRFGSASQAASVGVGKLNRALQGLVAGFAFFQSARFVLFKTAEIETQTRSLQVLTGELETAQKIIKDLQRFAAVTPFTSSELIDTAKRLKAFGVETEDLVETTQRLADVAGATGAELNGIATAYGQIQAKGKLQTEELLQLQERGIDIATELKKQYNLTGEEFSKALQKGQISAEAVALALDNLTSKGGKYANGAISQSDTLAGKFSTLQDNIDALARTLGLVLAPALKNILTLANNALSAINALLTTQIAKQGFKLRLDLFTPTGTGGDLQRIGQFFDDLQLRVNQLDANGVEAVFAEVVSLQQALQRVGSREIQGPFTKEFERLQGEAQRLITALGKRQNELRGQAGEAAQKGFPDLRKTPKIGDVVDDSDFSRRVEEETQRRLNANQQEINAALASGNEERLKSLQLARELIPLQTQLQGFQNARLQYEKFYQEEVAKGKDANAQLLEVLKQKFGELDSGITVLQEKIKGVSLGQAGRELEDLADKSKQAGKDLADSLTERAKAIASIKTGLDQQITSAGAITAEQKRAVELTAIENTLKSQGITLTKEEKTEIAGKLEQLDQVKDKTAQILAQQQLLENMFAQIGQVIETAIVDSIIDAIEGGENLQRILSDTLKSIGKLLIQTGVRSIGGGILGFSEGGIAQAGKPALVGEKGSEIIMPLTPTAVLPFDENANALANQIGNATANASVDAFDAATATMGQSTAVMANNAAQAEMGAFSAAPIQVEARTVRVGSMDVVSQEQFIEGMQRTAKTARAQLLNDLKNKPSMRGRIGI